jgi:hypothetical protein
VPVALVAGQLGGIPPATVAVITLAGLAGDPGLALADPGHWLGQAGRALARELTAGS